MGSKLSSLFKSSQTKSEESAKDSTEVKSEAQNEEPPAPAPAPTEAKTQENKDDVDIDISDPAVEHAAVKIQSVFRGHRERQSLKESTIQRDTSAKDEQKGGDNVEIEKEPPAAEPASELAGTEEAEKIDIDLDDPATAAAALKIQAGFRGHKVRKEIKENQASETTEPIATTETEAPTEDNSAVATGKEESTVVDSVGGEEQGDDSVAQEAAAIRIQSSFRGHKVRKEMKASRAEATSENLIAGGDDTTDPQGDVVNVAAEDDAETTAEAAVDQDTNEDSLTTTAVDTQNENLKSEEEATKAAIKIQASFRGHQVRKNMKVKTDDGTVTSEDTSQDVSNTVPDEGEN